MKKLINTLISSFIIIDLLLLINYSSFSNTLIKLSFILVLLLPKICRNIFRIDFNVYLEFAFILFVIIAQFFGCILNFYDKLSWYDSFAHFLSGIVTGIFAFAITSKNGKNILFNILFIISFSMMIASLWEIFEYISNLIFKTDPQKVLQTGINDTMKDVLCALGGTILLSIYYLYCVLNKKNNLNKLLMSSK